MTLDADAECRGGLRVVVMSTIRDQPRILNARDTFKLSLLGDLNAHSITRSFLSFASTGAAWPGIMPFQDFTMGKEIVLDAFKLDVFPDSRMIGKPMEMLRGDEKQDVDRGACGGFGENLRIHLLETILIEQHEAGGVQ